MQKKKKRGKRKTGTVIKNKVRGKQYFNKFEQKFEQNFQLFWQLLKRRKGQPFSNKTVSKRILSAALCIFIDAF